MRCPAALLQAFNEVPRQGMLKPVCAPLEIHSVRGRWEDAAQAARWLNEAWPDDYPFDDARATVRGWVHGSDGAQAWVAHEPFGPAVGMFSLTRALCPDRRPVTTLMALFVTPCRRNRGIGGELCEAAVDAARRLGLPDLYLYTEARENFYVRRGWRKVADAVDMSQATQRRLAFMRFGLQAPSC